MMCLRKTNNNLISNKKINNKSLQTFSKNKKKCNNRILKNYKISNKLENKWKNNPILRNKNNVIYRDE